MKFAIDDAEKERHSTITDLQGYQTPGYEKFKNETLKVELDRLAHQRMELDPADVRKGDRIQGQYNEVQRLMRRPEELQRDIELLEGRVRELTGHLDELIKRKPQGTQDAA